MVKAILFPLAFKAMAVMSSIAVLFSTMSLIASSIIGYTKLARSSQNSLKVIHVKDTTFAKDDDLINYAGEFDYHPYHPDSWDFPIEPSISTPEHHVHYYQ
ncbi:hypothetical protein JTB14_035743 [Gonioctena quinquepunctata]|nr:hypothetical protein JTB14_035743 [Gonioctena quinquepunctata]